MFEHIDFKGDLENEQQVLHWLVDFRDTVEDFEESDDEIIEEVNSKVLDALIKNTDFLAVLFCELSQLIIVLSSKLIFCFLFCFVSVGSR